MTTTASITARNPELSDAATRLYDAECALSAARATCNDAWVAAAADRLHVALERYEVLRAA